MMDMNDGKMINLLYHKTRFKCFFSALMHGLSVLCTLRCFLQIKNQALRDVNYNNKDSKGMFNKKERKIMNKRPCFGLSFTPKVSGPGPSSVELPVIKICA